jgi:REP element-mobilizing transposase RayT
MSHTYAHNLIHCVFSTKERLNLIRNPEDLWRYVAVTAYRKSIHVVAARGTSNHIHLLILLPQTMTLAKAMQDLKANTSRWLRETSSKFQWQEGYGAFSVSQSRRETVANYIANQAEHHRRRSFEEEFTELLRRSGIPYDPRFVFG